MRAQSVSRQSFLLGQVAILGPFQDKRSIVHLFNVRSRLTLPGQGESLVFVCFLSESVRLTPNQLSKDDISFGTTHETTIYLGMRFGWQQIPLRCPFCSTLIFETIHETAKLSLSSTFPLLNLIVWFVGLLACLLDCFVAYHETCSSLINTCNQNTYILDSRYSKISQVHHKKTNQNKPKALPFLAKQHFSIFFSISMGAGAQRPPLSASSPKSPTFRASFGQPRGPRCRSGVNMLSLFLFQLYSVIVYFVCFFLSFFVLCWLILLLSQPQMGVHGQTLQICLAFSSLKQQYLFLLAVASIGSCQLERNT